MLIDPAPRMRPATNEDVPALATLYAQVGRHLGPQVYSAEQVTAWANFAADHEVFAAYILDADTWVAVDAADAPLGFCGCVLQGSPVDAAYVQSLYVRLDVGRRGLGWLLLQHGVQRAHAAGARHFSAWATPFSRPLFERAGMPLVETAHGLFGGAMFERYRMAGDASAALRRT